MHGTPIRVIRVNSDPDIDSVLYDVFRNRQKLIQVRFKLNDPILNNDIKNSLHIN